MQLTIIVVANLEGQYTNSSIIHISSNRNQRPFRSSLRKTLSSVMSFPSPGQQTLQKRFQLINSSSSIHLSLATDPSFLIQLIISTLHSLNIPLTSRLSSTIPKISPNNLNKPIITVRVAVSLVHTCHRLAPKTCSRSRSKMRHLQASTIDLPILSSHTLSNYSTSSSHLSSNSSSSRGTTHWISSSCKISSHIM